MRLSTSTDRDEERAIAVLHAALDAGATVLDTSNAYCLDDSEIGHNERLIARALSTWSGDRSRIVVATKGGLTRPQGQWVPDGRAKHLTAACEASRRALGVERIALYQLHAPDPRTPLSTSIRALAALEANGLIERIGLCNVSRAQIERAQQIVSIDAVQVELSIFRDRELFSGVVRYCADHGITLIAHRPLGGTGRRRRLQTDPVLSELARRHRVTPQDIALAWLRDLASVVLPIPGPTRPETASRVAIAGSLHLSEEDRERLDARVPAAAALRRGTSLPEPAHEPVGEVVMIMGPPAAGKSTLARSFVDRGYVRINRDADGGSLQDVVQRLEQAVAAGATKLVVDNTYVSRHSRAALLDAARRLRLSVRGRWMATTVEEAQTNAVWRLVTRYGRLPAPGEIPALAKSDPNTFGPGVLFRYQRELEPPDGAEGFTEVESVPFARALDPDASNRAVVIKADGVLRQSRSGRRTPISVDDLDVPPECAEVVRAFAGDGWTIVALGWRPEIAAGTLTAGEAAAIDRRLRERLGVDLKTYDCVHPPGPPVCWCRLPLPGLGVLVVQRHRLDPRRCLYVGSGPQDPGFARRLGFQYATAAEVFGASADDSSASALPTATTRPT
jgi:aryl-alcohol dehydrogenase-like predicted oxidoreductase/histidinol phosphatase-like enzyme